MAELKISNWQQVQDLIKEHGNISLGALANIYKQGRNFLCPKCKGSGIMKVWRVVHEWNAGDYDREVEKPCSLCNSIGWTDVEYEAVSEVVRYEPKGRS